jgi:hypothetical protein
VPVQGCTLPFLLSLEALGTNHPETEQLFPEYQTCAAQHEKSKKLQKTFTCRIFVALFISNQNIYTYIIVKN